MPSALKNGTRPVGSLAIVLLMALAIIRLYPGCAERRGEPVSARQYPPPPQTPRVAALGELLFGRAPTDTQVQLSLFFFGVEPDPPAGLIRPIDVTADGGELYVCDTGLQAVFQRDAEHGAIRPARFDTPPQKPVAIEIAANGDRLVADMGGDAVLRYDRAGELIRRYTLDKTKFRPASALEVDSQVWVTNIAAHGIEVFDRDSAEHLRTIGERGSEPGRFGIPLGMARTPNGNVCVVDMLNNRVQMLSADGEWIRDIGDPGNRVGEFGRPKDVTVGADGTVFVSDASAARPLDNPAMLREFDVVRPYAFCGRCHVSPGTARISPHRQLAADGGLIEETCRYCHNSVPEIPDDGARRSDPDLRITSSQLCLNCHSRHWDFSQRGHVERPMPDTLNRPAELPLADGNVACYSCHNPHQAGLFPSGSVLGARATVPIDAAVALRMNSMELCIACHIK